MFGWADDVGASHVERRLVHRAPQSDLNFMLFFDGPRSWSGRRSRKQAVAEVLDLSLDGALLRIPAELRLVVSQQVNLRFGNGQCVAEVRREVPTTPPAAWRYYGVQFRHHDGEFRTRLSERLAQDRRPEAPRIR